MEFSATLDSRELLVGDEVKIELELKVIEENGGEGKKGDGFYLLLLHFCPESR